jgi:hypothetical protein
MAELEDVIERARAEWLREPNIVALGAAIKLVDGVPQMDRLAVRLFVAEKLDPGEVRQRGWRKIPDQIEDVPTDVSHVVQRPAQLLNQRSRRFDPLLGADTGQGPPGTTFSLSVSGFGVNRIILESEGRAALFRLCVERRLSDETCL